MKTILGRPWRIYASTVYLDCEMSGAVRPEGWNDWKKTGSHATARYAEFNSTGDGASPADRPDWTRQLKKSDAQKSTVETVLGGADNWNPDLCRPFSAVRRKLKWGETGGEKLLLDTWRRAGDDCSRRQKNVHGMADAVLAPCCE